MKKIFFGIVLFLGITICCVYFFLKFTPPLKIGTLASSSDNQSVVVGVGNSGFRELKIVNVLVNNEENLQ